MGEAADGSVDPTVPVARNKAKRSVFPLAEVHFARFAGPLVGGGPATTTFVGLPLVAHLVTTEVGVSLAKIHRPRALLDGPAS